MADARVRLTSALAGCRDVLAVFGEDDRLQWGRAGRAAACRYPERWHDVAGDAISAQLRNKLGIKPCQAKRDGVNRNGCRRLDVARAQNRMGAAV